MRDIVRHVDASPFLQTVQLGGGTAPPRFDTYGVHESVVAAPEVSPLLWCGVVWWAAVCRLSRLPGQQQHAFGPHPHFCPPTVTHPPSFPPSCPLCSCGKALRST